MMEYHFGCNMAGMGQGAGIFRIIHRVMLL
jgi:hypothetical protein